MFREAQQIGLYTLVRKLGKGGFGEVWLAERKSKFVTTKVAVKLPHDEQVDHETIKQEAQLWEQASGHPNILPIIDADEYDGQIVIVSEYAPDGSLDQWLKTRGKMPVEKAVEMTIKILDGLEFLHSRNIIHRDLKPANILLQGETPRLADFGISRALRTTASSQSSNVSGTFAYMPPEGFDGKRSVQTDVWSVGVNLYQFLTGSLPFPQKEPSALIAAIMMREFEPLPPDVPNNLQNAIARALAKQPENRYATAAEMREDLRRILRGEAFSDFIQSDSRQTFPAEQVTQIRKTAPLSTQNSQDENETIIRSAPSFGQSEKRKSSNVWMYATLALVLVGAIGLGVYFFANQSKQTDSNKNQIVQVSATQPNSNSLNSENDAASKLPNANVITPQTITPTPTPISYTGSYKSSQGGVSGRLEIKEIGDGYPKPFNFSFQTAAEECIGEIKGTAKWVKDNLAIYRIKNNNFDANNKYDRPYCQLTFTFVGKKIVVKENEYGCMIYYGVRGCGFNGTYSK
ncbi:MAG: serine/threonine protein kinase [Acidobacteriota bacterium]|nr:serine/threonine protein kinase [Acidobacteriota bacterium]